MVNRRQALVATAGGLLLAPRPKAQNQPITYHDINIPYEAYQGVTQALAALVNAYQQNGSVDPSLIDNAINWSQTWAYESSQCGLTPRVDLMMDPSDPNGLTGTVALKRYVEQHPTAAILLGNRPELG